MTTQEVLQKCNVEGNIIRLPQIKLDRNQYLEVKNSLELIGGKWKGGKTQGFVFEEDSTELLAQLASGEQRNLKKEFQFFSTPKELAGTMVIACFPFVIEGLDVKILEPSAGDGALIKAFREQHGNQFQVDCFELMGLNRSKLIKLDNVKIISDDFIDCAVNGRINNKYDFIIANPPFTKNQDIDHIVCMYKACKPGGIIVTLSSTSWQRGSQKKQEAFKEWLHYLGADITEIPAGAFAESGTSIETLMITIRKRLEEQTDLPDLTKYIKPTESSKKSIGGSNEELQQQAYDTGFINHIQEEPVFERQCRVCGCIENNCSQCIKKTGKPCHWVEEDLCSACKVPTPEEILHQIEQSMNESTKIFNNLKKELSSLNNTDMNFFEQLAENENVDLTIRIMKKNDSLTVNVMPGSNRSTLKPILLTGTGKELDDDFFTTVFPQVQKVAGILTNIGEVVTEAEQLEKDEKERDDKKLKHSKTATTKAEKKDTPAKAEKVEVTGLFDEDDNNSKEEE